MNVFVSWGNTDNNRVQLTEDLLFNMSFSQFTAIYDLLNGEFSIFNVFFTTLQIAIDYPSF